MQRTVRILGVDPGLTNTGWGVIDSTDGKVSFVDCGTIVPDKKLPMADRLLCLYMELSNVIDMYAPAECALEDVFVNKNPDTSLKLGQARGVLMVSASVMGIPIWEYQNRMVKKSITGSGRADKGQMEMMVKTLLPLSTIDSEHSADALAIGLTHAQMRIVNSKLTGL